MKKTPEIEEPKPEGRVPKIDDDPGWLSEQSELDEELFWGENGSDGMLLREGPDVVERITLLERTARFGEQIIRFCKTIPKDAINLPLINQLVRSGTSVGANYCEADDPLSRKDYLKSIGICRKESKETKYWLRMVAVSVPELKPAARGVWREAKELNLIFGAIYRKK